MHTTRNTFILALALAVPLGACGTSNTADEAKTEKPKEQAAASEKPADADADATAEGYEPHLVRALELLATGAPVTRAETQAYGCGVKYADAGGEVEAKIGEAAPAFTLPNLDGQEVSLADFAGKTVVLEWFNPDCPYVKYAHGEGGPLATLANEQRAADIVWLAINSGAEGKQGAGVERNQEAKAEWKLEHPILIDTDGKVGHAYGAKTTPHMFVIAPDGKLVYAGGLDNAPRGRVEG